MSCVVEMWRRMAGRVGAACVICLVVAGPAGCATDDPTDTKVVVPSAATSAPDYQGDGSIPNDSYVIRMSNGEQTWEVQFPQVATGYEMHIPLSEQKARGSGDRMEWSSEDLTKADKELLREMRRQNPEMRGDQPSPDGSTGDQTDKQTDEQSDEKGSDKQTTRQADRKDKQDKKASDYKPSYLLGIEEVRNLYRRGHYELAMVRLKKLEEAYPGDVKLLTMEGTLWMKLGKEAMARKAWERVLQVDPDNEQVKEALKSLNRRQRPGTNSPPDQDDQLDEPSEQQ